LIRIVLHGIRGPLNAKGQAYNLEMPAMGFFTDEEVAAVLSYIRERWSLSAKAIQAEQVRSIRTKKRTNSCTLEELGWPP
jgi:mono/diheme cytochrome c family protein